LTGDERVTATNLHLSVMAKWIKPALPCCNLSNSSRASDTSVVQIVKLD